MAYALAMKSTNDLKQGNMILVDTLIYALFSILIVGSIINPIMSLTGIKKNEVIIEQEEYQHQVGEPLNLLEKLKQCLVDFNT